MHSSPAYYYAALYHIWQVIPENATPEGYGIYTLISHTKAPATLVQPLCKCPLVQTEFIVKSCCLDGKYNCDAQFPLFSILWISRVFSFHAFRFPFRDIDDVLSYVELGNLIADVLFVKRNDYLRHHHRRAVLTSVKNAALTIFHFKMQVCRFFLD